MLIRSYRGIIFVALGLAVLGACEKNPTEPKDTPASPASNEPARTASPAAAQSAPTPTAVPAQSPSAVVGQPSAAVVPAAEPATSRPATSGPKYRCDQPAFTFPDAWDGDKIDHAFVIRNDGGAPLQIVSVQPTCGCTLAKEYDRTIAPGKEGRIEVTLDTVGRAGDVAKTINVTTNDPASEKAVLTLAGKVRTRISIDPPNGLVWGRLTPEMPLTRTVRLVNNTPAPMKVEPVATTQPSVFGMTVREVEPGKVFEVTVTARPPFAEGLNNAPLKLRTGMKELPELAIPCYLFVPPVVEVSPSWLMIRTPLAQETRRTVLVRYNGDGAMKIASITPSDPRIKTEIVEQTPGKAFNIAVTLPAGLDVPPGRPGSIVLATNLKAKPTITIEIRPAAKLTGTAPASVK